MADHGRFQQFVAQQPKRRRAAVVCVSCHEKKIKCDLQEITTHGYTTCTNCAADSLKCIYRQSNRDKRRRGTKPSPSVDQGTQQTSPNQQSVLATPPHSITEDVAVAHLPQARLVSNNDNEIDAPVYPDPQPFNQSKAQMLAVQDTHASISSRGGDSSYPLATDGTSYALTTHPSSYPYLGQNDAADTFLGKSGFTDIYAQETRNNADEQRERTKAEPQLLDLPPPELLQGFEESFFQYCYTWCPVLDTETLELELQQSPLLVNALALVGSHVEPPIMSHAGPAVYYDNLKQLFYGDKEENLIMCLKAVLLTYWWSPKPPSRVHRDTSWWWTTVAIRHAQHGGFYREPTAGVPSRSNIDPGLRRRIWWTLFCRERLTALCQDRPCVIDPEDCNVLPPSMDDFPEKDARAEVFIQWVSLCGVIGRIAKHLSRPTPDSAIFPQHLAKELITWVQSLPEHLTLPIQAPRTTRFNRDVHQLHLPYLTVLIVLHLRRSSSPLPRASSVAILAASLIARIFRDCLARGRVRYLMPISCWYSGMALLALLKARQKQELLQAADEDIKILLLTLKELRVMWPTANIFLQGYERLQAHSVSAPNGGVTAANSPGPARLEKSTHLDDESYTHGIDWTQYFPFATQQSSGLAKEILLVRRDDFSLDDAFLGFMSLQPDTVFQQFDTQQFDFFQDDMPHLPYL